MSGSVTQLNINCLEGTLLWAPVLLGLKKKTKPFLHLSFGKAGPFTLESHICVKALKCKVSQIIRCLIKPLLKNSIQTIFQGDTSWVAQLLNNDNCLDGTLLWAPTFGSEKKKNNFFSTFQLGKAGAFTWESHICVKALKCKVFQIMRCLIKPLLKNSTQTLFQGDTSWLAQLLNKYNCLDGTLLWAPTFGSEKKIKVN